METTKYNPQVKSVAGLLAMYMMMDYDKEQNLNSEEYHKLDKKLRETLEGWIKSGIRGGIENLEYNLEQIRRVDHDR